MSIRVAINGFGRIGRAFARQAQHEPSIEIVAINDLGNVSNLAYLLKYDSVYGRADFPVASHDQVLQINGRDVPVLQEKDPAALPWKDLNVDVVVESTGLFTDYAKAKVHIDAGAKRVVISAPAKGNAEDLSAHGISGATVLMGLNNAALATCAITSNASCTTNAASPLIVILDEGIGIEKAILNTTHAYTASQRIVDSPNEKDFREGRAAAINMAPASTGAAKAVTQAYPSLANKFDGIAVRVPVAAGSLADVTFISKRPTTVDEVNTLLKNAAKNPRWEGIFTVTDEPLVSTDIIGNMHGSIADLSLTRVVDGTLVKVLAWYDNEAGYTHTLIKHVIEAAAHPL